MFESKYLLIFFVFYGGASRCSYVAKLAHRLMGKDQKSKFLLLVESWISLIFNYYSLLIGLYRVIFSMTV